MLQFQSTLSVRRATHSIDDTMLFFEFQSTLSVRRATIKIPREDRLVVISIHALREESDADFISGLEEYKRISIHALREESDGIFGHKIKLNSFQSTLSVRRATITFITIINYSDNFNPRSP